MISLSIYVCGGVADRDRKTGRIGQSCVCIVYEAENWQKRVLPETVRTWPKAPLVKSVNEKEEARHNLQSEQIGQRTRFMIQVSRCNTDGKIPFTLHFIKTWTKFQYFPTKHLNSFTQRNYFNMKIIIY